MNLKRIHFAYDQWCLKLWNPGFKISKQWSKSDAIDISSSFCTINWIASREVWCRQQSYTCSNEIRNPADPTDSSEWKWNSKLEASGWYRANPVKTISVQNIYQLLCLLIEFITWEFQIATEKTTRRHLEEVHTRSTEWCLHGRLQLELDRRHSYSTYIRATSISW